MSSPESEDYLLYQQGRQLMKKGNIGQALMSLKRSAELAPHFKTYECIGECLLLSGSYGEAALYTSAAVGLGTGQFKSCYLLAKALIGLGDLQRAREKLTLALDLNPNYEAAKRLLHELSVA